MNIKKWFFLFWSCIAVGGVVTMVSGSIMSLVDKDFGFLGLEAIGFNALMMLLVGTMFGAFSQMCFFAYLTLNYIALSIFRKKYLWNALQGYTTVFAVFLTGYVLYEERTNNWFFWVLPLMLLLVSLAASWLKVKQTNKTAFIPTMFLMFVVTAIEAWPALQDEANMSAIVFMIIPLFVCNAYQNFMMHRLVSNKTAETTAKAA